MTKKKAVKSEQQEPKTDAQAEPTKAETIKPVQIEVRDYAFCKFTQEELNEKADELAKKNVELESLENRKKSVVAQCGANIAECAARIMVLSNAITNKGEDRYVDCVWQLNVPTAGRKSMFKKDNGEFVRETAMDESDYQTVLPLSTTKK